MKTLTRIVSRIGKAAALFVLAGAGIIGCATYQPTLPIKTAKPNIPQVVPDSEIKPKGIDLRNGYSAESQQAIDNISLTTYALTFEVFLKKTDKGYDVIKASKYHKTPDWNDVFDKECDIADTNKDKFITEIEAQNLLDSTYNIMNEPIWIEDK